FSDQVTFQSPRPVAVELIDVVGRVVLSQDVAAGTSTLGVGDIARGVYFLRVDGHPAASRTLVRF
ncbi:MAG: T9SS type A sorting domain-containing protein, partial [Rhodothermales bacterium]|nr:T9SS type A sorting domain-containing protein [Rhodothermales bacterium]